ncbi:helix-turn-helix transcriptional regulator [Paenibacillus sp. MBLB4367]|uniref:helix-turn-helix transcriptional regulator n=1 Tax=Paenibacillus sp. MBLB4367 TaxID=3384767 RepID=UPI0039084284
MHYANLHFREDLSLRGLAESHFMNPSYISQLFRKETGDTFTGYIAKLRIGSACELLDKEELPVGEIAERCGFHDYFYFTRLFKKVTGQTPTQYRNRPL